MEMLYRRGNLDQRGAYYSILGVGDLGACDLEMFALAVPDLEVPDSLESVPSILGRRGDRGVFPNTARKIRISPPPFPFLLLSSTSLDTRQPFRLSTPRLTLSAPHPWTFDTLLDTFPHLFLLMFQPSARGPAAGLWSSFVLFNCLEIQVGVFDDFDNLDNLDDVGNPGKSHVIYGFDGFQVERL